MPYTPREALTVALYNAVGGNEEFDLRDSFTTADAMLANLESMGFELVDRNHTADLERLQHQYDLNQHPSSGHTLKVVK